MSTKDFQESRSGEESNKKITLRTGGAWEEGTQLRVDVGLKEEFLVLVVKVDLVDN